MVAQLESIVFNHDPLSPVNGISLRRDAWRPLDTPEWRRTAAQATSVAAYAISEARVTTPSLRVQLNRTDPAVTEIDVRAVEPPGIDNVLGSVATTHVTFRPDGTTGFLPFQLVNARLRSARVGIHAVHWRWQWRADRHQPWTDLTDTRHTVYTVLSVPGPPWQQVPSGATNTQLPWTAVLDVACTWAAGAQSEDEAATRITEAVFALGPDIVEYGCIILGASQYSLPYFFCMAFLDRLAGGPGRGRFVNCSDCATIVSTFANILGCRLWQSTMSGSFPFALNEIIAIGSTTWRTACDWGAFNYHEVAWKEPCTADSEVFDACLLVDADADPMRAPHRPVLPVDMRFGFAGDGGYLDKLATPLGRPQCRPQPTTRQHRPVV